MTRSVMLGLAIIAAAIMLAALQATTPTYAKLTGPIQTVGRQNDTVSSAAFSARVDRVARAHIIGYQRFGRAVELRSSGVWIIVSAELWAFHKTMPIRAATLIGTTGRLYRQSRRAAEAPNMLSSKTIQPGLPTTGILVFELPEGETRDMKLVLSEQYDPQLKDQISVSLENDDLAPRDRLEIDKNGS